MKNIILILMLVMPISLFAQDRLDGIDASLSYKSKEITTAVFWEKDRETEKWESRKNNRRYNTVNGDNFESLFFGDYNGIKYLFIDYWKGKYRYPNLMLDWLFHRRIAATQISHREYEAMKNIQLDSVVCVALKTHVDVWKSSVAYTDFSHFLKSIEMNCSKIEVSKKDWQKKSGYKYSSKQFPIQIISLKSVHSEGEDVIRFALNITTETLWFADLESSYYEIPYSKYLNLFKTDKNINYK